MISSDAAKQFKVPYAISTVEAYGNGHINDTYLVTCEKDKKYVLQRINDNVFKEPKKVMDNIVRVTEYLNSVCEKNNCMKTLTLIPTVHGNKFFEDENGHIWRMYDFIYNAVSLELPETQNDFYQSAFAFGSFQNMLKDYPADSLYETIPDFHNTPDRYKKFLCAVEEDKCGRAKYAQKEIEFVKERKAFYSLLENAKSEGHLPLKVTHNDTKLNNVMLDAKTRKPVCVIDLDTIMPGFSVNDFGDSIRFGASTAAEDEKDLNNVHFDINLFEIYTKGFLEGCNGTLTGMEIEMLPVGAKMMTVECGMRFLTDYLEGDTYFKTAYPEHNLVRCRTQFKLVKEMEDKWDLMNKIVKNSD